MKEKQNKKDKKTILEKILTVIGALFFLSGVLLLFDGRAFLGSLFEMAIGLVMIGIAEDRQDRRIKKRKMDAFSKYEIINLRRILRDVDVPSGSRYFSWFINGKLDEKIFFFDAPTPYFEILDSKMMYRRILTDIMDVNIGYDWVDESTKKHNGVVKRAVIGGVLAGGVGAIIGGVTANSQVEQKGYVRDAWVELLTNDIDFRRILIHTGLNGLEEAKDRALIIRAIIDKNKMVPDKRVLQSKKDNK